MKSTQGYIWDVWNSGGPFVGDAAAPHGRVTVEPNWFLQPTGAVVGNYNKGPIRSFQRSDNAQVELDIPNILTISIDASIESDAATCVITMLNQSATWAPRGDVVGDPGYYSWSHGSTPESASRWGQSANAWLNVLIPNALLRTYEGYGGKEKTVGEAIADGNIVLTGLWLIDEVSTSTDGILTMRTRNMAKLLLEQIVFPPLVPESQYPISRCRWNFEHYVIPGTPTTSGITDQVSEYGTCTNLGSANSGSDVWYGCVDTATQALTRRGWCLLDELKPDDQLLGINTESGMSEWQPMQALLRYSVVDEPMVRIRGYGFDALTTRNHRWLAQSAWDRRWVWTMSCNLDRSHVLPRSAPYGDAPMEQAVSDDFVQLVAWYWTEGTLSEGGSVSFFQSYTANPDNCVAIRGLLTRLFGEPGPMCKTGQDRCVKDHPHPKWNWASGTECEQYRLSRVVVGSLLEAVVGRDKRLSLEFLLALTGDQLRLLVETAMKGDGTKNTHKFTQKGERSGDFQALCALAGLTTSESDHGDPKSLNCKKVSWRDDGYGTFKLRRERHISEQAYSGEVWCPTVRYGNWLARRNGTVYFTGNSNGSVHGHRASHAFDGSPDTYWYSVGNGEPTLPFALEWIEICCGGQDVNSVYIYPWAGNYECFISVFENGGWVDGSGGQVIDYDAAGIGRYTGANTANIPWVARVGIPWEEGHDHLLPRTFAAQKIRLSFTNLQYSPDGPNHYRAGVRECRASLTFNVPGREEQHGTIKGEGNYTDYAQIIRDLLLWSGFWLRDAYSDGAPAIYGNIEDTGIYADDCINDEVFDKKPVMDVITTFKEIVGYSFWVDDEGAARFESPAWWGPGNFLNSGEHTMFIPDIDERVQSTGYTVAYRDRGVVSEIIISSERPEEGAFESTVTTRLIPASSALLRGIVRPFGWVNALFQNRDEQRILAELVALHIFFHLRQGQVTAAANPNIGINDQVRIWDRVSSESYIHYVRGVSRQMDLRSGIYTMTLTTHWLGEGDEWVVRADSPPPSSNQYFRYSDRLAEFLRRSQARSVATARLNRPGSGTVVSRT